MADERLYVILNLVTGQYKSEIRQVASATGQVGKEAAKSNQQMGFWEKRFGSLTDAAKSLGLVLGARQLLRFMKDVSQAATDLGESTNAVEQIFGEASVTIKEFGKVSATAAGLATSEFQQMGSVTGALLQNYGFNADAAAKETIRLTQRASDMASVFNTDVSQAIEAINSALRGQSRPITEFAVNLSQADINARAVALGLAETTGSVDRNAEAVATLNLIYEQTNKTQGDFLRTSGDAANAGRQAAAAWENLKATMGGLGLPVLAEAMNTINIGLLEWRASFKGAHQEAAKTELAFTRAVEHIQRSLEKGEDPVNAFADGLLHIAINGDLTTAQLESLANMAGISADKWDLFGDALEREAEALGIAPFLLNEILEALGGVGQAAGEVAPTVTAISRIATASESAAREMRGLTQAQRDYRSELLGAVNPAISALNALRRFEGAVAKVKELEKEGKTESNEYREALLEVAGTKLEAQAALDAFDSSGVQEGIDAIALALRVTKEEARLLLEQLGLLRNQKEISIVVDLRTGVNPARLTREALATFAGGSVPGNQPQVRHGGGWMEAGRPYAVQRSEVFIPQQSGQMFKAGAGSVTNEFQISLHFNGQTEPAEVRRAVTSLVRELGRYESERSDGLVAG